MCCTSIKCNFVKFLSFFITTLPKFLLKTTGWPKSIFVNSNGYNSESMNFWPCWQSQIAFESHQIFLENCKQTAEKCKRIFENCKSPTAHQAKNAYFHSSSLLVANFDSTFTFKEVENVKFEFLSNFIQLY